MALPDDVQAQLIGGAEVFCLAESDDVFSYVCTLPPNHKGPWHIAREGSDGKEHCRWPMED